VKKIVAMLFLAAGVGGMTPAFGHGEVKPRFGGVVQKVNEVTYELVADTAGVSLYLADHDQPLPTHAIRGKITILQGEVKTEAELKNIGDHQLQAAGVKLGKGARVVAVLGNVQGKVVTVRFVVR
jgi:hypothetical protein